VKIFLVLVLFACDLMAAEKTLQKAKLALNWKAEPQFGGFYQAQQDGDYQKIGLDMEIIEGGSGTPTIQMLMNDKVDFAVVSSEEILLAADRSPNNKVVALFATYQTYPHMIMTHAERNFKSLQEVFTSDGILSIQPGLPYFQFLLKKYPNPKVQTVPYAGGVTAFLNNPKYSQQGFATSEPLLAEKAGAKVKTFLIADTGFNPYTTVLAVSQKWLKSHGATAKDLQKATQQGWAKYLKNPDKMNQYMASLNKSMDLQTFQKSAQAQKALIQNKLTDSKGLGYMQQQRWETLSSQLLQTGQIKTASPVKELFQN